MPLLATSLDSEPDHGNINRPQSIAIPNDPCPHGIVDVVVSRCKKPMRVNQFVTPPDGAWTEYVSEG
ncbi:hypothetical protein Tco_1247493, partial [Tanacetum coccineum]